MSESAARTVTTGVLTSVSTMLVIAGLGFFADSVTSGSIVRMFGGVTRGEFQISQLHVRSGAVRIYNEEPIEGYPCDIPVSNRRALSDGNGQNRSVQCTVEFSKPFASPSDVLLALTGFDAEKVANVRVGVELDYVSETEFTFRLETWSDTRLNDARVRWLVVGTEADAR